ncbi:MAG: response regulator transcription factor [Solirubrobacteraceae bacterium]
MGDVHHRVQCHPEQFGPEQFGPGGRHDPEVRVLAVDDHEAFREALRDLVAAMPGFVLAGQACTGEEGVLAVARLSPQLVLMDIGMPGIGGIEAARLVLDRYPEVMVVLISIDDPVLHPATGDLGDAVAYMRKQDLQPDSLSRLWTIRHSDRQ